MSYGEIPMWIDLRSTSFWRCCYSGQMSPYPPPPLPGQSPLSTRHVNNRCLKKRFQKRFRLVSHHGFCSYFLEECSLFRSDWAWKGAHSLFDSVYLCVCVCVCEIEGESEREKESERVFKGPSPDLEPISMQMLWPDMEGATIVRRGQAGLA